MSLAWSLLFLRMDWPRWPGPIAAKRKSQECMMSQADSKGVSEKPSSRADRQLAQDILHTKKGPLDVFFAPKSVAVVGASETAGSVGRTILWNLISNSFGGTVFPVNSKRASVLGIKTYPSIAALPDAIDLAVIATPAPAVPAIVEECVEAGVKGAIIISAGFKECGAEGAALENRILAAARRGHLRIIGPNCLGLMNPIS